MKQLVHFFLYIISVCCLSHSMLSAHPLRDVQEIRPFTPQQAQEFFIRSSEQFVDLSKQSLRFSIDDCHFEIHCSEDICFLSTEDFVYEIRRENEENILLSLNDDFDLAAFDIFLPFFSWKRVHYEGPGNFMGRQAQRFTSMAPKDFAERFGLVRVSIWLDSRLGFPLAWEAYDAEGTTIRSFRVRSFAKNSEDEWYIKRVQFTIGSSSRKSYMVHWLP